MRISYNWLLEYLPSNGGNLSIPELQNPEKLGNLLTSVGLEVETIEKFEEIKGGLQGLIVGEVLSVEKHPDADKLSVTMVNTGNETLQIVCGASNVAKGQKVIVARIDTTIYPIIGDPLKMKKAKIRGIESLGMICAEDEIGLGSAHDGILVLSPEVKPGTPVSELYNPTTDWIYEIGLTPNRMDAMSHLGVAKDVCAYLSHHYKRSITVKSPLNNNYKSKVRPPIQVNIGNTQSCQRYSGAHIAGVQVGESPKWLKERLVSIGLRPLNNIVDITNFILHETGQPLHAFDATNIKGKKVIVKNLAAGTEFITLDEKKRILDAADLMICDGDSQPMCIGGVFGGQHSGVTDTTTDIFLESAWFEPVTIRRSSIRHGLRTDAATRFEKGVDINNTVAVLKRAALLIQEIAGGELSEIVDVYPEPKEKTEVILKSHYLKKISGKNYHPDTVKNILQNLGFEILKEGIDDLRVSVPFSKPDICLPADLIEEIMRIDGYDNIQIPASINITPAIETLGYEHALKEKISGYLVGAGFAEIFTNSITAGAYFEDSGLQAIKIMNPLSADLDVLRPRLLETGLQSVAYNLNRKNNDLLFFEFGRSYHGEAGKYAEPEHLAIFISGRVSEPGWKNKGTEADTFFLKGVCESIFRLIGLTGITTSIKGSEQINFSIGTEHIGSLLVVQKSTLQTFSIRQPVFYADLFLDKIIPLAKNLKTEYAEVSKFPIVHRDISIIVDKDVTYAAVEEVTRKSGINKLKAMRLFDVFESEKLGQNKKSLAMNFTFADMNNTLTDNETEDMMNTIIKAYESHLGAVVRKG